MTSRPTQTKLPSGSGVDAEPVEALLPVFGSERHLDGIEPHPRLQRLADVSRGLVFRRQSKRGQQSLSDSLAQPVRRKAVRCRDAAPLVQVDLPVGAESGGGRNRTLAARSAETASTRQVIHTAPRYPPRVPMARVPRPELRSARSVSMLAVTVASTVLSGAKADNWVGAPSQWLSAGISRAPHPELVRLDGRRT